MLKNLLPPRSIRNSVTRICRNLYVETHSFVNPQIMRFTVLPYQLLLPASYGRGMIFLKGQRPKIAKCAAAQEILELNNVKGVLINKYSITVSKTGLFPWYRTSPFVIEILMAKLKDKVPLVVDDHTIIDTTILDTDDEVVATIKDLMATRVRPSVQEDGGDIFYEGFDPINGIVKVRLAGACIGCPSSLVTLRNGVENLLKHYIPEVKGIEEVGQVGKDIKEGKVVSLSGGTFDS